MIYKLLTRVSTGSSGSTLYSGSRLVSTLSPLTSAFNKFNPKVQSFPKLFSVPTGVFGYDLLREPSGFYLFREQAIAETEKLVKEAANPNRKLKMVQIFDHLSNSLCKVADMCEFIRIGHPSHKFSGAAEQASIAISAQVEKLNTNRALYDSLSNVVKNGDIMTTTPLDDHVARLFMDDFEQSGIQLDEDNRQLVVKLNEYILHVGSFFMTSTSQPRSVARSKLPEEVRNCFTTDGDYVVVNGLYNDRNNELVREAAYRIFLFPDEHQENLLQELLNARLRLATICGFESYAQRAVNRSIAKTPEAVWQLLDLISDRIRHLTQRDFNEMLKLKTGENKYTKSVRPWDVAYYTAQYKNITYTKDISQCSPYFSLGSCMEGLNLIFNSLFNVRLELSETKAGELWHEDVIKIAVCQNETNSILGYIYCDFYERGSKPYHDCHYTIQGGCQLPDGSYQLPIVVLILSLPNPKPSCPTFLTPLMVDNLFHEMGHAMHSMLARTPYQHITGTRCSTDLAEVPSILMEFFASDHRVVQQFARHHQTGETIPSNLLDSWIKSKSVFLASDISLQVFQAALDQVFHSKSPLNGKSTTTEVLAELQEKYYGLPYVTNTGWQLRFGHLVGYGAKYYSYLVSKAVANSIWQRLFINDPLSSSAGEIYRRDVLSHGGGKPSIDIVNSVLQCEVNANSLANSLVNFVESSYDKK